MIILEDNFNSTNHFPFFYIQPIGKLKRDIESDRKIIGEKVAITLKEYISKEYPKNTFFSFYRDEEKINTKNEDNLIISIKKDGDHYLAKTGNYVGKFVWKGLEIDIKSRFSNIFLERMLNFVNDIFLDDVRTHLKNRWHGYC